MKNRFVIGFGVGSVAGVVGIMLGLNLLSQPISAAGTVAEPQLLIDNGRIRARRLVLEPGQSTGKHTHEFDEVVICLKGSKLRATKPGPDPEGETHYPEAGQVFMPSVKGVTHILTNVGDTPYEQIAIELKE